MKKNKDPYPITHSYLAAYNLVDAATVIVTDLCENLSNVLDTSDEAIVEEVTNIDTRKFNSVSVSNGADGCYPVWLGVDQFHKVRKIFANTNESNYSYFDDDNKKEFISWSYQQSDLNDQFFKQNNDNLKRLKLFDIKISSSAIFVGDHGGNFGYEHHDEVINYIEDEYFKDDKIYQKNYPLGLYKFTYGTREVTEGSSFVNSKIHNDDVQSINKFKDVNYSEFLSNLLNEEHYPTKYIFEKYIGKNTDYTNSAELIIRNEKISTEYLLKRLPKAIAILKIQTKILFPKKTKKVFKLRKKQLENFIFSIIKDIEQQELKISTFNKTEKRIVNTNKLTIEKVGLPSVQDTLFDGFKLKSETSLKDAIIIPVKNGKYPCYVHSYPADTGDDDVQYNAVYIVVEGIEGCYLNKNSQGQLVFNKDYQDSGLIRDHIQKRSKKIKIDQIDLRDSESVKELEKVNFVEELELHGLMSIKNWKSLSKLQSLKKLKLVSCQINSLTSKSFFENLYSLDKLEEFVIDDSCEITVPEKSDFPKNIYLKKLKSYTIEFRTNWKNGDEKYPEHKGYGDSSIDFLHDSLPNIYTFPNFEKFKSLEKLKIYNYFDLDSVEGILYNYDYEFNDYHQIINELCKVSKIKDIWIYGYNFGKVEELTNTKFLGTAIEIFKHTNVKINGINKNTFKKFYLDSIIDQATSIVIIDDNCGYNKSKIIEDIQIFNLDALEYLDGELPDINIEKIKFPSKDLFRNEDGYNPFDSLFNTDNLFDHSLWSNTLKEQNNYNHFIDRCDYEDKIIFVKQSYLTKNKNLIFNNIKHLYYFCIRKMIGDGSPIFWKDNERFSIPSSIKLDNLETLHLSCGRKTSFKDIEKICGNSLKYLIVNDMLVDDFSMPIMPKLEKLLISYIKTGDNLVSKNNKIINDFRKFENIPNLNHLSLNVDLSYRNGIKLGAFGNRTKIKELKISYLDPKYVDEIAKINSLQSLDISLFEDKKKITTKNFEFLKPLKNLKNIKLSGGYVSSIEADFKKIISYITKNIKALGIDIVYKEDNHNIAYECISEINKRFKNLIKLDLNISSNMSGNIEGSNFDYDKNSYNFEHSENYIYCHKKDKLESDNFKYKFIFDINEIKDLTKLEILFFAQNLDFDNQIINENKLFKFKNLSQIVTDTEFFSNKFYNKITKQQNDYYLNCKKLKKYNSIKSTYSLEGKEWEKYKQLGIKVGYGYHGETAESILEERKKNKK